MNNIEELLAHVIREVNEVKNKLSISSPVEGWLPRKDVMKFMSYGNTQMTALEKSGELVMSKVGKRKFFTMASLLKFLEKNIQR